MLMIDARAGASLQFSYYQRIDQLDVKLRNHPHGRRQEALSGYAEDPHLSVELPTGYAISNACNANKKCRRSFRHRRRAFLSRHGGRGGMEGPAYNPQNNLILVGEVDWCATVKLQKDEQIQKVKLAGHGRGWMVNPYHTYGTPDSFGKWAGWVYAVDADTGVWKWRLKSNYPVQSGMTPTAGGVVFSGDMGGNFYALDAATGQKLWGRKIGGAIGGGSHHLYRERCAESCCRSRLYSDPLANGSCYGEDRNPGTERHGREPLSTCHATFITKCGHQSVARRAR